ncbi:hypothetical protein K1719_037135 [Acacia pycnantha]|nr:hypothetical protein K1719_037135 [Acacia pycnantha]
MHSLKVSARRGSNMETDKAPSREEQLKAATAKQSNSTPNSQQPTSQATQQQCGSDSLNSQLPPQPTQEEPTSQSSGLATSHAQPSTRRTSTRRARSGVSGFGIRFDETTGLNAPMKAPFLAWRCRGSTFMNNEFIALWSINQVLPTKTFHGFRYKICYFAKKSAKKSIRKGQEASGLPAKDNLVQNDEFDTSLNSTSQNSNPITSRTAVLQACTITSGLLAALGLIIRQVSHIASMGGLPVLDCSSVVSFDFEMWHLELIIGLILLSLVKQPISRSLPHSNLWITWPLHSFLVLVRNYFSGALLPLLGMNWISIGVVALVFGVLHLGSGRKYSFAIWATFVGLAYGYATILSSSIVVPMASHALNNLIGGILWRYSSNTSD